MGPALPGGGSRRLRQQCGWVGDAGASHLHLHFQEGAQDARGITVAQIMAPCPCFQGCGFKIPWLKR